jgi:hypothetical protein
MDFDSYSADLDANTIFTPHTKYQYSVALGWSGWDMTGRHSGGNAINMTLGSPALALGTCNSASQGCCDATFGKMIGGLSKFPLNFCLPYLNDCAQETVGLVVSF